MVFQSCLLALFSVCPACDTPTLPTVLIIGTFVQIDQLCDHCQYHRKWNSQPYIGNIPAGNILLSGAVLFAGALPTKTLRVLNFFNCASISLSTFYKHQKLYLHPVISSIWRRQQTNLIGVLQAFDEPLTLGGDARMDSPGYSAKYGSYTFMDLKHNVILDIELVQVSQV